MSDNPPQIILKMTKKWPFTRNNFFRNCSVCKIKPEVPKKLLDVKEPKVKKVFTINKVNEKIRIMEYPVRGPIHARATEIVAELKKGTKKPFKEVIRAHLGDCQAMGQKPITFLRQLVSTVAYPELLNSDKIPCDVKQRAKLILSKCNGKSIGSIPHSAGNEEIRKHCANYIEKRDGYPSHSDNIILSAGASYIIKKICMLLTVDLDCLQPGIMTPVPEFPLYAATLSEMGILPVHYYLNESDFWSLDLKYLKKQIDTARLYCEPRAIVVINPGNPTGQVLTKKNIEELIKFAYNERLVIIADEVYQDNIYAEKSKFYSFKKTINELGYPYNQIECCSLMSVSKGYTGECGLRGGYVELFNIDPEVKQVLLKLISTSVCAPTLGQVALDTVVNPPTKGEPSYEQFQGEKAEVLESLKIKSKLIVESFNSFEGFKCNPVQGAMYAFPKITLPPAAIKAAEEKNQLPDLFYCLQLLEHTGITTLPGSSFGQEIGTFHFRTTILPPTELLKKMLLIFDAFHKQFFQKYK